MKTQDQIRYENRQIPFWNRETYLEWRAEWRARYARASQGIRDTKRDIREAYRSGNFDEASNQQRILSYLRPAAHKLMKEREEATKLKESQIAKAKAERLLATA